ncbi:MAG: response regulator transcription factor [Oscillospiraceae bacterium]|nr:response regulator transcription factor [Oscillospiraceae bacterium]
MRILVVDDEKLLVKGIKFNLENEGYTVDACYDGEAAVEAAKATEYDLILLDCMMPKKDGLQACQEIRSFSTVPIIMLTAKSEGSDLLMGFESGADDYVTKPFNILELKARIRSLIRRSTITAQKEAPKAAGLFRFADVEVDPNTRSVRKGGNNVELTIKEYDLIEFLVKNPGKVYTRENLMDLIWGYDYMGDTRTVDVHIRRLREKLEPDPASPEYIVTKWGVGYYFKAGAVCTV